MVAGGGAELDAGVPDPDVIPADDEAAQEEEMDTGLVKALDSYRALVESGESPELDVEGLEDRIREIKEREIISADSVHEPEEAVSDDGMVMIGPPVLTRFEKARIMGARALQLSLGAPAFIDIPETATTSLDIAMEELERRVIPITIRRVLPNGDYQNIPIGYFK